MISNCTGNDRNLNMPMVIYDMVSMQHDLKHNEIIIKKLPGVPSYMLLADTGPVKYSVRSDGGVLPDRDFAHEVYNILTDLRTRASAGPVMTDVVRDVLDDEETTYFYKLLSYVFIAGMGYMVETFKNTGMIPADWGRSKR